MKGGIKQDEYEAKHNDGVARGLELNEGGYHYHPDEEPSKVNPPPLS
jgi:hypothetical protein